MDKSKRTVPNDGIVHSLAEGGESLHDSGKAEILNSSLLCLERSRMM